MRLRKATIYTTGGIIEHVIGEDGVEEIIPRNDGRSIVIKKDDIYEEYQGVSFSTESSRNYVSVRMV